MMKEYCVCFENLRNITGDRPGRRHFSSNQPKFYAFDFQLISHDFSVLDFSESTIMKVMIWLGNTKSMSVFLGV